MPPAWAFSESRAPKAGDTFHLRGEPLRSKTNPTVSELLVRRMKDMAQLASGEDWYFPMQKAVSLALALGIWDGPANTAAMQHLMSALIGQYKSVSGDDLSRRPYLIGLIVDLTLKRCELGDKQALGEYTAWLSMVRPADTGDDTIFLFEPALQYSSAPEVEGAIRLMFLGPSSPWVPLVPRKVDYYNIDTAKLLEKLMGFAAFREQMLKNLGDKSVVGTLLPRPASPDSAYDLTII